MEVFGAPYPGVLPRLIFNEEFIEYEVWAPRLVYLKATVPG